MQDHTPPTADGAAMYYRVLFPDFGPWRIARAKLPGVQWAHVVDHESRDGRAQALCRKLWNERHRMRATAGESDDRVAQIHLEDSIVGEVRVIVCLECPWVEWGSRTWTQPEPGGDYRVNHQKCLIDDRQDPSDRHMRLTMRAADLGLGEWGVWYDKFNPQRVRPAGYGLVGMANYWAGLTHALWQRREELRAGAGRRSQGGHRGAFLKMHDGKINRRDGAGFVDSYGAWAVCLECMWLKYLGNVHDHPNWKEDGQAAVLEHEADPTASG